MLLVGQRLNNDRPGEERKMDLSYYIIRTLQKYSSPKDNKTTKPLKRESLVKLMQKEYPDMSITSKKVRRVLDELVNMESSLPDEKKTI